MPLGVQVDELNEMIDKLWGRALSRRARLAALSQTSADLQQEQLALNHIENALERMRRIRDALQVNEPTGFIH